MVNWGLKSVGDWRRMEDNVETVVREVFKEDLQLWKVRSRCDRGEKLSGNTEYRCRGQS